MHFSLAVAALVPVLAVYAVDIPVMVGANGTLAFSPSSVQANINDNIIFTFMAKNHSATQSTFATPCAPMAGGVDSGFQFIPANSTSFPQWNITINNSTPTWFFCAQTNPVVHCQMGMVFAVNPTANKTFAEFQAAAQAGGGNSTSASSSSTPGASGVVSAPGSGSTAPAGSSTGGATSPAVSSPAANSGLTLTGGAAGVLTALGVVVGLVL